MAKMGRNEPCHCGSGKKYKNCHGGKPSVSNQTFLIGAGLLLLALAAWFGRGIFGGGGSGQPGPAPAGKVWSAEHGHWHDAEPMVEAPTTDTQPAALPTASADSSAIPTSAGGYPQPPGDPPPGKVWSPEHGHWHESNPMNPGTPQPPGEPPAGKVWSVEHGHWHQAPTAAPTDSVN